MLKYDIINCMKKICVLFVILSFSLSVYAELPQTNLNNLPQGTFKKNRKGQYVQYDKNGKKVGIYKIPNGRYVKVK